MIDFEESLGGSSRSLKYEDVTQTIAKHLKSRVDLFPPNALALAGEVLAFGEHKHPGKPWKKMSVEDHMGATYRHLLEWQAGRKNDTETGRSHLAHALCRLAMALDRSVSQAGACSDA